VAVTAYPQAKKGKSLLICRAFVEGCNGVVEHDARELRPGTAFFYGIDTSNEHLWQQCLDEKRDYLYCDNSYFDATRQTYFRITRNGLQHSGEGATDCKRLSALGLTVKPRWRERGEHLVLCPQSEHFMTVVCRLGPDWLRRTQDYLARVTPREQRIRGWQPDKMKLAATLEQDLAGAHVLITHSSAAAITAIMNGVPAIVTGQCAATPMAGTLAQVENPPRPSYEARWQWAGVLADAQWKIEEMRQGVAWQGLERQ
jgi:hypothetical protein